MKLVEGELLLRCTIMGKPFPKERPKGGRGVHRTPEKTVATEAEIRRQVSLLHWRDREPFEGLMALTCVFYGASWNADGDNLLKLIADALAGPKGHPLVFTDDRNIKDWHAYVRDADEHGARTEIRLTALEATE